jgi:hypothetical protein
MPRTPDHEQTDEEVKALTERLFETANRVNAAAGSAYMPVDGRTLSFVLGQATGTILKLQSERNRLAAQLQAAREHWDASVVLLERYDWKPFGSGVELVDPDIELEFFGQEFTQSEMPIWERQVPRDDLAEVEGA